MEVNIFGEGAVGYKNIVKSSSSQDFFLYKKYKNYAVCTVADGHSMDVFKYSHIGSYLACQSVFEILKTYPYRVFETGPLGNRLGRETAIFHVGTQRQVQAYLILNDHTLSVLNNYMKLIRDDYLK